MGYGLEVTSGVADAGVAHILDTDNSFTSGTLLSVRNNTSTKLSADFEGSVACHDVAVGGALTVAETTVITGNLTAANAAGPAIVNEAATATNPTLCPDKADIDTGLAWAAADALTLVAGGVEGVRVTEAAGAIAVVTPGTMSITGNVGIGAAFSANADLKLEAGRLMIKESTTPIADAGYGKVYTKTDNGLYFQDGAGVEHEVNIAGSGDVVTFKGYGVGDFGTAGTHYIGGFYESPAAHAVLTIGGTVTQTYGTAGRMKAAHAFCVASAAGGTDLVLTVTGVSITDAGVRNDTDSEIIVADADTATTDAYYETTKKWLGQVTYTLTGAAGAFTFNYGFTKYDDFGNRDITVTDFEAVIEAAASETGFDIQLLHHSATGWTYSAAAFVPGGTVICSSLTDFSSTNDNSVNNEYFAYKRTDLTTACSGSTTEGTIIKIITAVNNSIKFGDCHIGFTV